MKILVENGQHLLRNMGDVAMAQVTVQRLRDRWPNASIDVVSNNPALCARYFPHARSVYAGLPDAHLINIVSARSPNLIRRVEQLTRDARRLWAAARLRAIGRRDERPMTLFQALLEADVVVASGGGYVNDGLASVATNILSVLEVACRFGKPVAMFGQGIGPLQSPRLRRKTSLVLSRIDAIGLREGRASLPDLLSIGIDAARVTLTGDDALALGGLEPSDSEASAIGLNLRVARSTPVAETAVAAVADVVETQAQQLATTVLPVPISFAPEDTDVRTLGRLLPRGPGEKELSGLDDPRLCARQVADCRIVVTGSYHAAVFALAQGRPAICLTATPYYDRKFLGLCEQFGPACRVIDLNDPKLRRALGEAIITAWEHATEWREALLLAARRSADASVRHYHRFFETVASRCAFQAHGPS